MDVKLPVGVFLKYLDNGIKMVKDVLAKGEHVFGGAGWKGFSLNVKLNKLPEGQDFPPGMDVWDVNVKDTKFVAEGTGKFLWFSVSKKQGIYIH